VSFLAYLFGMIKQVLDLFRKRPGAGMDRLRQGALINQKRAEAGKPPLHVLPQGGRDPRASGGFNPGKGLGQQQGGDPLSSRFAHTAKLNRGRRRVF